MGEGLDACNFHEGERFGGRGKRYKARSYRRNVNREMLLNAGLHNLLMSLKLAAEVARDGKATTLREPQKPKIHVTQHSHAILFMNICESLPNELRRLFAKMPRGDD